MKDILFLLFIVLALAVVLYFCNIFVIQKTMSTAPEMPDYSFPTLTTDAPPPLRDDPAALYKKQSTTAEDTWERQKRMMEDQRQKMRDTQSQRR